MLFKDRTEAGKLLAKKLNEYQNKDAIVYGLPRGGVVIAVEIARYLHVPLDLIITRKIGHPFDPEYAIGALTLSGDIVGNRELSSVDPEWLVNTMKKEQHEIQRRKERYLQKEKPQSLKGKIAILVDDGVATGFTLLAGITELRHKKPSRLIVAVPVIPQSVAKIVAEKTDKLIALATPKDNDFLQSVGAYYATFTQVEDDEVVTILKRYNRDKRL